jgi:hypothetical protein
MLQPLSFSFLNWTDERATSVATEKGKFSYPKIVRIDTIADGSCFFHAITNAFFLPYWQPQVKIGDRYLNKSIFIRKMRNDLAYRLTEPAPKGEGTNYDQLSRGTLGEFAKGVPEFDYTIEKMQACLRSNQAVDYVYYEFISNQLNKDIYILDAKHRDVYPIEGESSLLYKNRESIVLLYQRGHYELVGLHTGAVGPSVRQGIETIFQPTHPFIQAIRTRLRELSIKA